MGWLSVLIQKSYIRKALRRIDERSIRALREGNTKVLKSLEDEAQALRYKLKVLDIRGY